MCTSGFSSSNQYENLPQDVLVALAEFSDLAELGLPGATDLRHGGLEPFCGTPSLRERECSSFFLGTRQSLILIKAFEYRRCF